MKTVKKYEKPSMEVYQLKQCPKLLAGSDSGGGSLSPMGDPEDIPFLP